MSTQHSGPTPITPTQPPSRHDIYHVAFILRQLLPAELIPAILNHAEYWLLSSTSTRRGLYLCHQGRGARPGDLNSPISGAMYLSSLPVGLCTRDADVRDLRMVGHRPVRKMVFTIECRDPAGQMRWGAREYHSWFEASVRDSCLGAGITVPSNSDHIIKSLARTNKDTKGSREPVRSSQIICTSDTMAKEYRRHVVTWSATDSFAPVRDWVAGLHRGQVIDLTLYARTPGQGLSVGLAKIDVYLAAVR